MRRTLETMEKMLGLHEKAQWSSLPENGIVFISGCRLELNEESGL
jgi:hypothetical protein